MNNSISPISFKGDIALTLWKQGECTYKFFKTTEAQDRLIKSVVENISPAEDLKVLSKKDADFFHKLIEFITNQKIPNVKNEKILYHNGVDNAFYADKDARLVGGVKVDIDY